MNSDEIREAFLKANARPEYIASEFADVIRSLMRAVSAGDSSAATYKASERMKSVADLLQRCPDPVSWYSMFADAVELLLKSIPDDADDLLYVNAAKRGTKYLVEVTATDNAASGRASRRLSEFRDAIRWSEEARGRRK